MTRKQTLIVLLLIWATLWVASLLVPAALSPTGDGFTRGMNRVSAFFGLQFAAGIIGLAIFSFRPDAGPLRWLSVLPAGLAGGLIAGVVGLILWAWLMHPGTDLGPIDTRPATKAAPIPAPPYASPSD